MQLTFEAVTTLVQINALANIAATVWHEHFASILSPEQIDYMVDKFQSSHALTDQLTNGGYRYFFLMQENTPVGYTGFKLEDGKLFLSKLYLLKEYRKHGYASQAFAFLENICHSEGLSAIWLTVNRYNADTIQVYEHKGFQTIRTQVADIGNGFVMDDFIMEKKIEL